MPELISFANLKVKLAWQRSREEMGRCEDEPTKIIVQNALVEAGFKIAGGMWGDAAWYRIPEKNMLFSIGQGETENDEFLSAPWSCMGLYNLWLYYEDDIARLDQPWGDKCMEIPLVIGSPIGWQKLCHSLDEVLDLMSAVMRFDGPIL